MKYRGFFLHGSLLLAFAILAPMAASAQSSGPLKSVKIRLDWRSGSQHSPFFLGKAQGLYQKEGIDLQIISGSGSSDTVKQVGSGAVEFGLADSLVLVQGAVQKVPAVSIAVYYQRTPIVLLSPKKKPVTSPKQLLGGIKLGNKKGSATSQGLSALLAANGIAMKDVNLIDIGFGVQPLLVGQVDAMMGFAMNEPVEAEKAGMAITVMPISDFGVKAYGLTIISNSSFMKKNPDLVKGFLRATVRAIKATIENPEAAVKAVTKAVKASDAAHHTKVLKRTMPYWMAKAGDVTGIGVQTAKLWQGTIDIARKLGLIETAVLPAALFTNEFLPTKR